MRKLYAFLWSLLALSVIVPAVASAQTYSISSYLVRSNNETWQDLSDGTAVPGLDNYTYNYYEMSQAITVPFSFRFADLTGISQVFVNGLGSVVCSPSWTGGMYDYGDYYYYYILYYPEYTYPQYGYGYAARYQIIPWANYNLSTSQGSHKYGTIGTAPNRRFVVETKGRQSYTSSATGDWQVQIFESGISTFQLNFHGQTNSGNWYFYGEGAFTGLRGNGAYNWLSIATSPQPVPPAAPIYSTSTYYDNENNSLPTVNYRIFIAYPYDLSVDQITNPSNNSIKLINSTITPTVTLSNQGSNVPTSVTLRMLVRPIGDTSTFYQQDVTLTGSQIPQSFTSTTVNFPNMNLNAYGIYEDTVFIVSETPTDQFNANNIATSEFTVSPPNNIRALTLLTPAPGSRTPIAIATPMSFRFKNIGFNDQTNVPVTLRITDPSGNVVYRDTVIIQNWPSGAIYDTTFRDWTPAQNGQYKVCGIAIMSNDQLRADDTSCTTLLVRYERDVAAVSVFNPQADEEKPAGTTWKPIGVFQSVGVADLFDVPARVVIKRCSDGAVVFQADSTIPELNVDQNLVKFGFPTKQGSNPNNDISKLAPGCYTQCVIARLSTDGDRTNDTACTTFSIIPKLSGDIFVGVGQRFQTLHAAVDSLKFRGVSGNLRLILTDNRYVENGTYTGGQGASTPSGALDFTGIIGTSDTSTITIMPRQGVNPRIVFTGNRPFCFYFGHNSPSYVKFEGYNPLSNPVPDKYTAEPSKRQMTIVDSSTVAGGVFAFEWGPSNISVRNLKLLGNQMYSNDSDAVIRIYMEPTLQTYLHGIRDTMPEHNIRVENCAIGGAKYGIWDHGAHTQFNLHAERFQDWRNYNNVFTRNTIGDSINQIGKSGIQFNNEQNLTVSHNEIAWVNANLSGSTLAYGINQGSIFAADTGNVVGTWIDANRIHNITSPATTEGIAFHQAATIYTVGSGSGAPHSTLPVVTMNRTTNNMVYDLRGASNNYPVVYNTTANTYFTDRDSVFNNSISTKNATVNVYVAQALHAFLWNNVIQNTGTGSYTNYYLQLPRPFVSAISSDYNLFDLRGANRTFATVQEYDRTQGTLIQTRSFRRLNDWRTYTNQDIHSLEGDPMFSTDSLHLPGALSYIASPASNNGAWLGTASETRDFDGDLRLQGNQTPDIGADEFEGFQFTNDLAVNAILSPGGYSQTSDTTLVTMENPLWITAAVKNLSSQAVFNRTVTAKVELAQNGGAYQTIYTSTSPAMNFDVNETKNVTFQGPTLTQSQIQNGVFRVTVSVPNDQNNANNVQTKVFRVLLKTQATLVTYDAQTAAGIRNRDSVTAALRRLGVAYDSLDRSAFATIDIDYTPWWTVVWSSGNPTSPFNTDQTSAGALSFKATQELEHYLQAGRSYAKKSLVIAGQNLAFYNGFSNVNGNNVTDTEFFNSYLHTRYVANSPTGGAYNGWIRGQQVYWTFPDSLSSQSPDVVKPSFTTPLVGPEVTGFSYAYLTHPSTPSDSGAGTTYSGPTYNTVFFGFDWADARQTNPGEAGGLTSGTTRIVRGALDFIQSHAGTVLPVEFTDVKAERVNHTNAVVTWQTANQKDIARFEIEVKATDGQNGWSSMGSVAADKYAFTATGLDAQQGYTFRVVAVDLSGAKTYSSETEIGSESNARAFELGQNYPNPFNAAISGTTTVGYNLPVDAQVTFRILDVTGKVVSTEMASQALAAGPHSLVINAANLASGSYVYEMTAVTADGQKVTLTRKMTINK